MSAASKAIRVIEYDPVWPDAFRIVKTEIAERLGDLLGSIHHIGSTAVPGLPAKPKIDIDAVVRSPEDLPEAVAIMRTDTTYAFHGDPYGDGKWTFTQGRGPWGVRLYLCAPDNETHRRRILFRDYLRTHPERADAYAALKRRLASDAEGDWSFYTGGKTDFVNETVRLAEKAVASPA